MEKSCLLLSLIISVGYVLAGSYIKKPNSIYKIQNSGFILSRYLNLSLGEGDCDSGECTVKDWTYKGEKQFACANTGWSGGNWCPTASGVDASGKYTGGWKKCTCGRLNVLSNQFKGVERKPTYQGAPVFSIFEGLFYFLELRSW